MRLVVRPAAATLAALGMVAVSALPALAQMQAAPVTTERASAPPARFSVKTTPVNDIVANPKAKAALESVAPDITAYYRLIGKKTLTQVAALSGGQMDDAMLKKIQAEFDKL